VIVLSQSPDNDGERGTEVIMRVFVAGGAGVIGERLVPILTGAGHEVVATTRSQGKAARLASLGATPVILDGLDAMAVGEAVGRAAPEVVIHQMTALAGAASMRNFDRAFAVTNRLRTEGTDHLLAAAIAAGARLFIAQSYTGWPNTKTAGPVTSESDPFDDHPVASQRESLAALRYVEQAVANAPMPGIVLRYGSLYGPGASDDIVGLVRRRRLPIIGSGAGLWSFIHADDAASATAAAMAAGVPGVYNIVDDDPAPAREWLPYLAAALGAKPPLRVPRWLGRLAAGEAVAAMMTQATGSSNARAKREFGWAPRWATWREGFRRAL
jgi:2-alkyl-3-oxoalkanoate reductase